MPHCTGIGLFPALTRTVRFIHVIQKSDHVITNNLLARMAKVCGFTTTVVANFLKVPRSREIFSMPRIYASVELFSVTYLGLNLSRKRETQRTSLETNCARYKLSYGRDLPHAPDHEFAIT